MKTFDFCNSVLCVPHRRNRNEVKINLYFKIGFFLSDYKSDPTKVSYTYFTQFSITFHELLVFCCRQKQCLHQFPIRSLYIFFSFLALLTECLNGNYG